MLDIMNYKLKNTILSGTGKKAEVSGEIIVYIFGILVVSLVVIYGYSAIQKFIHQSEEVDHLQFEKELTGTIYSVASDYGTVKIKEFSLPSDITEICFIDLTVTEQAKRDAIKPTHPLIHDSWSSDAPANIFLLDGKVESKMIFSGDEETGEPYMRISDVAGWFCINSPSGKIKLRIEGKGSHAIVGQSST